MRKIKCLQSQQPVKGRSDKKFRSLACKNTYNYQLKKTTAIITREMDEIQHRNYEILQTLMPQGKALVARATRAWP